MPTREALTSGVLDLVLTAGPVAKAILLILALFSIVSLGLMFEKWRQFRRVRRQTLTFLKVYRDARTPALVHASVDVYLRAHPDYWRRLPAHVVWADTDWLARSERLVHAEPPAAPFEPAVLAAAAS